MVELRRLSIVAVLALGAPAAAQAVEFQDCDLCPVMVEVPPGGYERSITLDDPLQAVQIDNRIALGKYEVTVAEFTAFVVSTGHKASGCEIHDKAGPQWNPEAGWTAPGWEQTDAFPAICVSWDDAQAYVEWLRAETGEAYRLPSEAEWDYAAHAGGANDFAYAFRAGLKREGANCEDCAGADLMGQGFFLSTEAVGTYPANAYGLFDIMGNAAEWVQDCFNAAYEGAPADGAAWLTGNCDQRVTRGGAWSNLWAELSLTRVSHDVDYRGNAVGFRVARDLD